MRNHHACPQALLLLPDRTQGDDLTALVAVSPTELSLVPHVKSYSNVLGVKNSTGLRKS